MKHAFEIYSPDVNGVRDYSVSDLKEDIVAAIEQEFSDCEWYRIRYHICRNDIQQPCDPWETVAEKGEIPVPEE